MAQLSFFVGKGGVGKTTLSAAYAVRLAKQKPKERVLLLSSDPAHSLADVLEVELADAPVNLAFTGKRRSNLYLWQIHAEKQFRKFLDPQRDAVLQLIENGTLFTRDEIEPLLDNTLPGMAEISALLAIHELLKSEDYDHIVVDTAPIGHTLRLFELPQHFSRFLDFLDLAGNRDRWLAQRFSKRGPVAETFLQHWQQMLEDLQVALSAEHSQVFLVTSPERFSLNEAVRSADALHVSSSPLDVDTVILNRVVREDSKCPRCHRRFEAARAAMEFLEKQFSGVDILVGSDPGQAVIGLEALQAFAAHVFDGKALAVPRGPAKTSSMALSEAKWPSPNVPLSFTLGKGGVGKTTITAALAFEQRKTSKGGSGKVIVCSTDPAPSLDDVFLAEVGGEPQPVLGDARLLAMEIDSVAEFREWAERMQQKIAAAFHTETAGGVHIDLSFDRQVFSALLDIVPPGVDEILAIFRILKLLSKDSSVMIDMAPTGHALELLRMPDRMLLWTRLLLKSLAPHRTLPLAQDVAVEIATLGAQIRDLLSMLKDGARAQAFVVTLPELMPERETVRLIARLAEIGIAPQAIFINRVLMTPQCTRCRLSQQRQQVVIARLAKEFAIRKVFVVENMPEEIAGRKGLDSFTARLWQWQLPRRKSQPAKKRTRPPSPPPKPGRGRAATRPTTSTASRSRKKASPRRK